MSSRAKAGEEVLSANRKMPIGRDVSGGRAAPPGPATTRINAGVVTLGVEFRRVRASDYPKESMDIAVKAWGDVPIVEDQGLAVYVFDTETGEEYLRFDCLGSEPHYHYMSPATSEHWVVPYDVYANGANMLAWTLTSLRSNLRTMLTTTGGAHLVGQIDDDVIDSAVERVRATADFAVSNSV